MSKPVRIQMSRQKGWRKPENTIYCGRPGLLGNPFPVDVYGREKAVQLHRDWLDGKLSAYELMQLSRCDRWSDPPGVSLTTLRAWVLEKVPELRGKNLACWCALDKPCHVDALLERANRP
jgi:hypothetical protein